MYLDFFVILSVLFLFVLIEFDFTNFTQWTKTACTEIVQYYTLLSYYNFKAPLFKVTV